MNKLRNYQTHCLKSIITKSQSNKKIAVQSPTGSGKTEIIKHIVSSALVKKKKVLIVAYGVTVVDNLKKRLDCSAGVIISSQKKDYSQPVQVMSITTFSARYKKGVLDFLKDFDLVIIDEAHNAVSESYNNLFNFLGDKFYIGFSATFFKVAGKYHNFWDTCINEISTGKLIELGFLNNYKLFLPETIDTRHIKTSRGEYDNQELETEVNKSAVVGKVVEHYKEFANNKTCLVFCTSVKHSKNVQKEFELNNIECCHLDAQTSIEQRNIVINKLKQAFKNKKPFVITNILVIAVGSDIPEIEAVIHARPTLSEVLYVQSLGRGLRITPNRNQKVIIIDMTRNTFLHGLVCMERTPQLNKKDDRKHQTRALSIKACPVCFAYSRSYTTICPECLNSFPTGVAIRKLETVSGKLVEYKKQDTQADIMAFYLAQEKRLIRQRAFLIRRGYKKETKPLTPEKLKKRTLELTYKKYKDRMKFLIS